MSAQPIDGREPKLGVYQIATGKCAGMWWCWVKWPDGTGWATGATSEAEGWHKARAEAASRNSA